MPDQSKWDTVKVEKTTKQRLERIFASRRHELLDQGIESVTALANKYLVDQLEREEAWRGQMPLLKDRSISEDGICIHDYKQNRDAILTPRDGQLYCDIDKSYNCIHIGFAFSIPQVNRIMEMHGSKRPK